MIGDVPLDLPVFPRASVETATDVSMTSSVHMRMSRRIESNQTSAPPKSRWRRSCCKCMTRRKADPPFQQMVVVMRHSERLDQVDPNYGETELGQAWPHDAPLTDRGVNLATEVAEELHHLNEEVGFSAVATSPYLRCLQTAAIVAKRLDLPVVIDQELSELWGSVMPKDHLPHRSPIQLQALAEELGIEVMNPEIPQGGLKLFGKAPVEWPEELETCHKRYLVRIETYIRLSASTKQNYIIVGHAPGVVAAINIFERGNAEVLNTEFCGRVIARRAVMKRDKTTPEQEHGVYAAQWSVVSKAVDVQIVKPDSHMVKYYENMHLEVCDEAETMAKHRAVHRTSTDTLFDQTLRRAEG